MRKPVRVLSDTEILYCGDTGGDLVSANDGADPDVLCADGLLRHSMAVPALYGRALYSEYFFSGDCVDFL